VEWPSKCEPLSSNPNTTKRKKGRKEGRRKKERNWEYQYCKTDHYLYNCKQIMFKKIIFHVMLYTVQHPLVRPIWKPNEISHLRLGDRRPAMFCHITPFDWLHRTYPTELTDINSWICIYHSFSTGGHLSFLFTSMYATSKIKPDQ
jgi:hypothetical protein